MKLVNILALAGLAAAAPAALEQRAHLGTWTLRDFQRTCDDTQNVCGYSFTIVDSTGAPDITCLSYDYVKPTEPGPGVRSARFSSPSNLACAKDSPVFFNVGYDKPGNFWVIVPVNTATNKNAFFGYSASEMVDRQTVKPDHTASVLVWGQFKREAEAEPVEAGLEKRNHLGQWTVRRLVRTCPSGRCDYNFEIARTLGGGPIACTLSVGGPNTQSYFGVPCQQNPNWVISWGYNSQGYAVMTVVDASARQNAWFGFNNVVTVQNFPDSGPSTVAAQ